MKLDFIIDKTKATKNSDGIWAAKMHLTTETRIAKKAWERIYNLNLRKLLSAKEDFNKNKLKFHLNRIVPSFKFTSKTIYLEIGCGPSYIGDYLLQKYDCNFIGIDFNYQMLLTLKKYFDSKKYKKYILIYADITDIPLIPNSVDYIYGGGVIEHLKNTNEIVNKLYYLLKKNGVLFNTIPAFNLWWLTRFWNNIPNNPKFKRAFEYIHIDILKGSILNRYYGYELSYSLSELFQIHKKLRFKNIRLGPFNFAPSSEKLKNPFLRWLYMFITSIGIFSPVYYVYGKK